MMDFTLLKKMAGSILSLLICFSIATTANATEGLNSKLKVLIVDGQNNHIIWPKSTFLMKKALEDSGRFTVDNYRTQYTWKADKYSAAFPLNDGKNYVEGEPKIDESFTPNFEKYHVVISNFGWKAADWPQATQKSFEQFVANGGGFVSVHAADNSFPLWPAYNEMIGLGGWGDRNAKDGPYVYYQNDELVVENSEGFAGAHGKAHAFEINTRVTDHPITKGLPKKWLHTKDELYNRLRGPAKNMTVLATAYDDPQFGGFGRHEPVLMTINYQQGRIFHTTLGHDNSAFESIGFITTLLRGAEWAATGEVTLPIPDSFKAVDEKPEKIQIMILGSFHFNNPSSNLHGVTADDVLTPKKQQELVELTSHLLRFKPTKVAVEIESEEPNLILSEYHDLTDDDFLTYRNESLQIGYRVARASGHTDVYGIDEQPKNGEPNYFPYEEYNAGALANNQQEKSKEIFNAIIPLIKQLEEVQAKSTITETLLWMNNNSDIQAQHAPYYNALVIGNTEQQVGADLNAMWYLRNAKIFAKILQVAKPGDRVLVVYGAGHTYWLRHFAQEMPGVEWVDVTQYLTSPP